MVCKTSVLRLIYWFLFFEGVSVCLHFHLYYHSSNKFMLFTIDNSNYTNLSYLSIGSNNFFCEIWAGIVYEWNSFRMKPHWKKFDAINYFSSKESLICSALWANMEFYVNIPVAIDYLNSSIRFSSVYMQFRYIYAIPIYMRIIYHVTRISYIVYLCAFDCISKKTMPDVNT